MLLNYNKIITNLEKMFQDIPAGKCNACGECCVNPSITLAEYMYVFKNLLNDYDLENIVEFLTIKPKVSSRFKGNLECPFQINKLCSIHKFRPLICRIQGLDVLNHIGLDEQENCPYFSKENKFNFGLKELKSVRNDLNKINQYLYKIQKPPFYLYGFDIITWTSILSIDESVHRDIEKIKRSFFEILDIDSNTKSRIFNRDYVNISKYLKYALKLDDLLKNQNLLEAKELIEKWDSDKNSGLYMYLERKNIYQLLLSKGL